MSEHSKSAPIFMSGKKDLQLAYDLIREIKHDSLWSWVDEPVKNGLQFELQEFIKAAGENYPDGVTLYPGYTYEGQVVASGSFFDGKIRKVLEGESKLGDPEYQDELRDEFNFKLKNWLMLRRILGGRP